MRLFYSVIFLLISNLIFAQSTSIPHLVEKDGCVQVYVNNKPFLLLAGELHNSSAGSACHMRPIWERLAEKNLNTVLAPVSWELVEPEEGSFDFSLVDSMITGARDHDLKLVILWFGSWKNGKSSYVPEWVKRNPKRFPLIEESNGKFQDALSPLGNKSLKADICAFVKLMEHIKEIDSKEHTVIMVQVENEMGVLGASRDFSGLANQAFEEVPSQLIKYFKKNKDDLYPAVQKAWCDNGFKTSGSWEDVFGKGDLNIGADWKTRYPKFTDELFMAWNYATYVGAIAEAGKSIYPLPMFVNAWLKQPKANIPGKYPSGGPLPHVIDIWRAAAPAIDFIAPDIYMVEEFDWVCQNYLQSGNLLFIPETKIDSSAIARSFYAFGRYRAIGFAPFGIEGGGLFNSAAPNDHSLQKGYECLKNISQIILENQAANNIDGVFLEEGQEKNSVKVGKHEVTIQRFSPGNLFEITGGKFGIEAKLCNSAAAAIIIKQKENEFLIAGTGDILIKVSKVNKQGKSPHTYISIDELIFKDGKIIHHRLNGDETAFGGPYVSEEKPKVFKIKVL
ncbi:GH35 family beta-galactosidase [Maribellus maritimus]|uniref:GH35 family beta-galactosidase n=1 Tax=Maribellus maritimus TaxID=2870838 RepID=UPI001EECE2C5|nr:DUF5597 domain-containing protein [Maribellus maritimus]MCG6190109.1 DUF5597 domain-containing protein [Maribellus maritimus]